MLGVRKTLMISFHAIMIYAQVKPLYRLLPSVANNFHLLLRKIVLLHIWQTYFSLCNFERNEVSRRIFQCIYLFIEKHESNYIIWFRLSLTYLSKYQNKCSYYMRNLSVSLVLMKHISNERWRIYISDTYTQYTLILMIIKQHKVILVIYASIALLNPTHNETIRTLLWQI